MFNQQTVSSLQTLGAYMRMSFQKKCRFSKDSVLNPQTAQELSPRLGFLPRTLWCMERQLGSPLTDSLS